MNTSRERDQTLERLLRQSLLSPAVGGVTDACLDAETMAAWMGGGLSGAGLETAQSHVADCGRCQALLGELARIDTAMPAAGSAPVLEHAPRRWFVWVAPFAAAAAAVAIWVVVPREAGLRTPAPREATGPSAAPPTAPLTARNAQGDGASPLAKQEGTSAKKTDSLEADALKPQATGALGGGAPSALASPAATAGPAAAPMPLAEGAAQASRQDSADIARPAAAERSARPAPSAVEMRSKAALAAAAPPAAAAVQAANRLVRVDIEVVSPDPQIRWRLAGPTVQRSVDGGSRWETLPTGTSTELTAGSAPAVSVCWLVGRGGVVLLSTDGRTWRRIPFPEITDLSSVQATGALVASVVAVDGRTFTTTDGGATWSR